jgi:hypothetical protein
MKGLPADLRLARLVVVDRVPEHAGPPVLEPLSLLDGLLALIPQSSSLARLERPLQTLCKLAVRCGGVYRLTYAEIADAVPVLTALLSETGRNGSAATWEPVAPRDPDDVTWALLDGQVRRRALTDAVAVDEEALLMVADIPVRLAGLGRTVWDTCAAPVSMDRLVSAVVDAHGPHPEAEDLVEHTVADLCAAGVLGRGTPFTVADMLAGHRR